MNIMYDKKKPPQEHRVLRASEQKKQEIAIKHIKNVIIAQTNKSHIPKYLGLLII